MSRKLHVFANPCRPGCLATIVKFGDVVGSGETPTSGKMIRCPECGAYRPYDAVRFVTSKAYAFDANAQYLGEMKPE